jgi:uncharacterized protein (TIGR02646 family)
MLQFDKKDALTLHNYPPGNSNDWFKPIFIRVKANVKKHFCVQQKRKCVYCKTELNSRCHSEHIEHVVNRALKPAWMFEPFNLGVSCGQCNTQKGEYNTLKPHLRVDNLAVLPHGKQHYNIVHPHFDNYDEHLEIEDEYYIKAKTVTKGEATIDMCKLWRPLYADRRAKEQGISLAGRATRWLIRVQKPGVPQYEKDEFLKEIENLTKML